jgi:hypothetical protein
LRWSFAWFLLILNPMNTAARRWGFGRKANGRSMVVVLFLGWLSLAGSAAAAFLSTEAEFLTYVGASQNFLNEFNDLVDESPYAHALKYSSNGLSYEITSTPIFEIYSRPGFVSTSPFSTDAEIVVSFTTTNVHAAGSLVFLTDGAGAPTNGILRVVVDAVGTNTLPVAIGQPAFAGYFTGGSPFTGFRVRSQTPGAYPALDHFRVAEGLPLLTIAPSGPGAVTIRWPAPATGYVLQFSLSLANPSWTKVQTTPQPSGYFSEVTVLAQDAASFFRLFRE